MNNVATRWAQALAVASVVGLIACPDGGIDVDEPDSGTPDASTPDTGRPDSGSPDSGTPDTSTPDTGLLDTVLPDTASPDAGLGDASLNLTAPCDDDGVCGPFESCNSCPQDCGGCDISRLGGQRAKYVDLACPHHGDGLTDSCASSAGAPGRFNALQPALDTLAAGDTLYLHPGDYWRVVEPPPRDSGGIFTVEAAGASRDRPIVITAADRGARPVLHSCDPQAPSNCPGAAIATYGDHIILDHLRIRGRAQAWGGTGAVMQYLECWHGWGACDGNWACLRIEACTDCLAHHNDVHDVRDEAGRCDPDEFPPRETGLKEFSATRTIWELNTVRDTVRWAYDLHRNSVDPTVRFNLMQHGGNGVAIHIDRSLRNHIYGNVVVHAGGCINAQMVNEDAAGETHVDEIHHNTCAFSSMGISTDPALAATIQDNAMVSMMSGGTEQGNINAAGTGHQIDHNAYDANSYFHQGLYDDGVEHRSLSAWQATTGYDSHSVAAAGGACTFVDAPDSPGDEEFDLRVSSGVCLTLGGDGGEVGAYGITDCVGHLCP